MTKALATLRQCSADDLATFIMFGGGIVALIYAPWWLPMLPVF